MMALEQVINYDTPSNFVFDASKVEIVGGVSRLKLLELDEDFTETFDSSVGFAFDAAKTEFVAGAVRQKDQRPMGATFGANYSASIDGSWGDGVLTGTATGGAAVAAGKLDLDGFSKYVDYAGAGNAGFTQVGAVRFRFTPNYTTKPASDNIFFTISDSPGSAVNRIAMRHVSSAGQIQFRINDSAGVGIITATLAGWSPTAGVEYEFEANFDFTGGNNRIFIDGVLHDSFVATGTRTAAGLFRVGGDYTGAISSNGKFDDMIVFGSVQHVAPYTPGYTVIDTSYDADDVTLPQFVHVGPPGGTIKSFDGFVATEGGAPRYTLSIDGGAVVWWDGATWSASAGTYASASTSADIDSNIATLPGADGATTINVSIHTDVGNTQASVDVLTFETTAQTQYPTDNPTIYPLSTTLADGLEAFSTVSVAVGSDAVRWTVRDSGVEKWWDGAVWVVSSGFAETNTAAEIDTNAAALDISGGSAFTVTAHLHSDDGTTSPDLTSSTFSFSFFVVEPDAPNVCIVYGWVKNIDGSPRVGSAVGVFSDRFEHGTNVVNFSVSTTTDAAGYWEIPIVESATIALAPYTFTLEGERLAEDVLVPDDVSAPFDALQKMFYAVSFPEP